VSAILSYPWHDRMFYSEWLAQSYFYVKHSTRLLARAASKLSFSEVDEAWHKRFCLHLAEEHGHEQLALKDLQTLGAEIVSFVEFRETTDFYAIQYYVESYEFMGYILALEAIASETGAELLGRVGIQPSTFLRVHAHDDVDHVRAAVELVDMLTRDQQSRVYEAKALSTAQYFKILDRCRDEAGL
jgi:pyrroloquinoline quinone (PQQ) biosynthesis protein C